jgi:hypothetical protein
MAAAEYYSNVQELPGNHPQYFYPPKPQPKPPQYQQPPAQQYSRPHWDASYNNSSLATPPSQQQLQTYAPPPQQQPFPDNAHATPPYPTNPPQYPQSNTHLGPPLQHQRSRSQPSRVHFAKQESDMSDSDSFSDTSASSRRRHRHRRHDSDRPLEHHRPTRAQRHEHKDRDTFLGAGAGALVGDVIFPGLGTAAGILLGGIGGRKYAKRSKSEDVRESHKHRDAYREGREEGREHHGMVKEAYREGRRDRGDGSKDG